MATKKTRKKEDLPQIPWKQVFFLAVLSFIVVGSLYALTSFAAKLFYEMPRAVRVNEIYAALDLPDNYLYQDGQIAGEKRVYLTDGTRSWSSYKHFLRGATLQETAKELDARITATGFSLVDQPNADSPMVQRNYKNERGEYIRISLLSKPRFEYFQNAAIMGTPTDQSTIDPNTGPIDVTIKVNLDTNNE